MSSHMCLKIAEWRRRLSQSSSGRRRQCWYENSKSLTFYFFLVLFLRVSPSGYECGPGLQESPWRHSRNPNRIKTPDDRRWTRCPRLLLTGRSADTLNASVLQLLMQSYFSWKLVKVSNASPAGFFFSRVFVCDPLAAYSHVPLW